VLETRHQPRRNIKGVQTTHKLAAGPPLRIGGAAHRAMVFGVLADLWSSLYAWITSLCCAVNCTTATMKVNDKTLRVVKLLAEGGFSFVYLVEDSSKKQYALKKVLSQLPEQSELARWEVQVHKAFKHPNLLPLIDDCAVPTSNGAEEFRLLMPLFESGTLLDRCTMHLKAGTRMPEKVALRIFEGVLQGILQFHQHTPAWAHRDVKPANVLLGPGDVPVLMDFGSAAVARKKIGSRQEALLLQEDAAQNCSMPYRAPELFDVPSNATIDERTDVFSLGATLYAMAFVYSPFECTFQDDEQRVVDCSYLRVIGGAQYPSKCEYSKEFIALIEWMLTVDPQKRPTVVDVIARVQGMLGGANAV